LLAIEIGIETGDPIAESLHAIVSFKRSLIKDENTIDDAQRMQPIPSCKDTIVHVDFMALCSQR
jgi:hypothetical protein